VTEEKLLEMARALKVAAEPTHLCCILIVRNDKSAAHCLSTSDGVSTKAILQSAIARMPDCEDES
jgi:hypothetical protein